tara:strand:+ start:331 stop:546 length:216 start_codon:yes stop_codon:yes gene_type:complete
MELKRNKCKNIMISLILILQIWSIQLTLARSAGMVRYVVNTSSKNKTLSGMVRKRKFMMDKEINLLSNKKG